LVTLDGRQGDGSRAWNGHPAGQVVQSLSMDRLAAPEKTDKSDSVTV